MGQTNKKNQSLINSTKVDKTPHGRDEIKEAVLDATEKLLSEYSPNEITIRQIAKFVGISHTLIHRHFGTKENVIMSVHERSASKTDSHLVGIEQIEGNTALFFRAIENHKLRRFLLTKAMTDEINPHLIQQHFPVMQRLLALLQKKKSENKNPSKYDAEFLSVFLASTTLGYLLYQPFLFAATEIEDRDKKEFNNQMIEFMEEILEIFC